MPLGASRLNTLARYIVSGAPPAGSWADFTSANIASQFVSADDDATNSAVIFDGTDDFYEATSLTTTATDGKYLVFVCNFFYRTSTNMHLITVRLGTANGENGIEICNQSGNFRYSSFDNTGASTDLCYANVKAVRTWNQFAVFVDHSNFSNSVCYINGVEIGANFLNGSAVGGFDIRDENINWGSSNVSVKIGEESTDAAYRSNFADFNGRITHLYMDNRSSLPAIANLWDSTRMIPKDLGTDGTATGCPQPLIYHYGGTSTFPTNNGTGFNAYTLTANGNVATAKGIGQDVGFRTGDVINCGYDDYAYIVGSFVQTQTKTHLYRFSRTGSTLSFDDLDSITTTTYQPVINFAIAFDLNGLQKSIYIRNRLNAGVEDSTLASLAYVVYTPTGSGGVSISEEKFVPFTGAIPDLYLSILVDPNDETKICMADRDGVILHMTFDDNTDTLSFDDRTDVAGVVAGNNAQYCLIDNAGTTQIACFFYDGTDWKVTQMDMDGTNSTSTTLISGASLGFTNRQAFSAKIYATCTDFIYMANPTVANEDDMVAWTANWNGSSWTAPTTTQTFGISTDTANFNTSVFLPGHSRTVLEPNVWLHVHSVRHNSLTSVRLFTAGVYTVTSGTITQKDLIDLNTPLPNLIGYSNQETFGISLTSDNAYAIIVSDNADDLPETQSLTMISRPTS